MGPKKLLDTAIPKLKQHMAERARALTSGEVAEFLGVSEGAAYDALVYMEEVMGIIKKVKRGRNFYFLKGAHTEGELDSILPRPRALSRPGGERPYKGWSKYDPILDDFMEGIHKLVEVAVEGLSTSYLRDILDRRIKARGLGDQISVYVVNKKPYLEKF